MYSNTNQPIYRGGMHPSSYHWDHQLRSKPLSIDIIIDVIFNHSFLSVPNHDHITVSGHPNDSPWYTGKNPCVKNCIVLLITGSHLDSVLCQPAPTVSSQHSNDNNAVSCNNKPSQHPMLFPTNTSNNMGPRAVIPSKRAAQNRAAQRAFRQRKERYVKDLEKKAKLMDEWKAELDLLRQQNQELRENQMRLEKQIHQQQQQQQQVQFGDFSSQDKLISPITSPALSIELVPAPVVVVMNPQQQQQTKNTRIKIKKEPSSSPHKILSSFMPVNLRAPDQTAGYHVSSPTTSCSSSSSMNGLDEHHLQQQHYHSSHPLPNWNSSAPHTTGLDPYDSNQHHLDFMSGGQVLDDFCAVLQTRQRPDIHPTTYASMVSTSSYVMSTNSSMVRSDALSRTY